MRIKITEDNLVKELKNKNPKALDYLVKNYSNLIFKVVISIIESAKREDAMECVNDVFLKVWEKISYHDETKNKFSSWLIAVSKYNAFDYKRKLIKIEEQYNVEDFMLADEKQVESQILSEESKGELLRVIDTLRGQDKAGAKLIISRRDIKIYKPDSSKPNNYCIEFKNVDGDKNYVYSVGCFPVNKMICGDTIEVNLDK